MQREHSLYSTIMLRLTVLCVLLLCTAVSVAAQQSANKVVIKEVDYLIYFPAEYDEEADRQWPLLIFLHGGGETGTDVEKLKVTGLPRHIEEGHQYPMIIVSPQEHIVGQGWDINTLHDFYHKITEKYPVDKNRVYLTGLSMGGFGTWNFAIAYPELFAAIIPICGGTHMPDYIRRLKRMPVWCFHGDADTVVPLAESEKIVEALKRIGGDVKFTVYPGVGHDSWTETYLNQDIYEWLLRHKRIKNTPVEIDQNLLELYAGNYRSETGLVIRFVPEGAGLKIWFGDTEGPVLNAASGNEFYYDEYAKDLITFENDELNERTGVYFNGMFLRKEG